jgi:acyl carrier protein
MRTTEQRVVNAIAEQIGVNAEAVAAATNMRNDLSLDSLDEIEIVMALEDEFDINIEDNAAEKWESTADVVAFVNRMVSQ